MQTHRRRQLPGQPPLRQVLLRLLPELLPLPLQPEPLRLRPPQPELLPPEPLPMQLPQPDLRDRFRFLGNSFVHRRRDVSCRSLRRLFRLHCLCRSGFAFISDRFRNRFRHNNFRLPGRVGLEHEVVGEEQCKKQSRNLADQLFLSVHVVLLTLQKVASLLILSHRIPIFLF